MLKLLKQHFSISRIGVLYKDFTSSKELNPEGYEANIKSWEFILQLCLDDKYDRFTIPWKSSLVADFTLPTIGAPLSIGSVVEELVRRQILVPEAIYLDYHGNFNDVMNPSISHYFTSQYWLASAKYGVWKAIGINTRYIHWPTLVKTADTLMTTLKIVNYTDRIFTSEHLKVIVTAQINVTDLDFRILVKYLEDSGHCVRKQFEGDQLIKFGKHDITELDIGIGQLKWNIHKMSHQLEAIETQLNSLNGQIRDLVKTKANKVRIKSLLHIKRVQETSLAKLSSSWDNLSIILTKMDDNITNSEVYSTLAQSAKVLKELYLKVDDVDEVKLEVNKYMKDGNDVNVDAFTDADTFTDVEQEYNELIKEETHNDNKSTQETEEKDLIKRLDALKVTPTTTRTTTRTFLQKDAVPN